MSRKEKIAYIKNNYPDLFAQLRMNIPLILIEPDTVSERYVNIYNQFIVWYSGYQEDASILRNLSF